MAEAPISVVCDVEIDGVKRQAWVGEYMPGMLETAQPNAVRDLIESDLRASLGLPTLRLISWRPINPLTLQSRALR